MLFARRQLPSRRRFRRCSASASGVVDRNRRGSGARESGRGVLVQHRRQHRTRPCSHRRGRHQLMADAVRRHRHREPRRRVMLKVWRRRRRPADGHPEHCSPRAAHRTGRPRPEERRRRGHHRRTHRHRRTYRHRRALQLLHLLHLQLAPLLLMQLVKHHHTTLVVHLLLPLLLNIFTNNRLVSRENLVPLLIEAHAELLELVAERRFVLRVLQSEPMHSAP
jgi:hypothetical protein